MKKSGFEKDAYWNFIVETLPPEKLRELQVKKFKRIFEWAYEKSKFHRGLYQEAGIEPGDIKSYEDVSRVPKVEKSMMRDIQRKDPFPYGDALCVPLEEVTEFRQTSGTTGKPVYQPDTWQDWEWWSEAWAYLLYAQGYRKTDRVFIPFGSGRGPRSHGALRAGLCIQNPMHRSLWLPHGHRPWLPMPLPSSALSPECWRRVHPRR